MSRNSLKSVIRLIDARKASLPIEQEFIGDLKRSIELEAAKNQRKPSKSYKPSSMNCIRNMYYQRVGIEPDESIMNFTAVGITNSGTDIHERIQTYVSHMKDNNIDCEYIDVAEYIKQRNLENLNVVAKSGMETKLYHTKFNLSFMCDGIIRYKGKYYILELKTETSFKFEKRTGVDPKHYTQGTCYSLAFGIDQVIFVYINRDVLDMRAYMFEVTDDMKQEVVGKIEECDSYVKRLIAPPKPEEAGPRFCQYCSYRSSCSHERN